MDETLQQQALAALQRRASMVEGGQRPTVDQLVKDIMASGSWASSAEMLSTLKSLQDRGAFVTTNQLSFGSGFGIRVVTSIDPAQLKKLGGVSFVLRDIIQE